jgi:hypothetical protein
LRFQNLMRRRRTSKRRYDNRFRHNFAMSYLLALCYIYTMMFDIDDMSFRLKKIPRIYKQWYEDKLTTTQRSIDLINREEPCLMRDC